MNVIELTDARAATDLEEAEAEMAEIETALMELRSSETSFKEGLTPPPESIF